jgi:hypothetical protein
MKASLLFIRCLIILLGLLPVVSYAQVGVGTPTPDPKSALDIQSPAGDTGLLIPRLTAAQRIAIGSPPQGLMVYQTDGTASGGVQTGFWYYAGSPAAWVFLNPGSGGGAGDDLGNHTTTQNLNLGTNLIVGNGGSTGLGVSAGGGLDIGQGSAANLLVGSSAGQSISTGTQNQLMGVASGVSTSSGSQNLFLGYRSGFLNQGGNNNQFLGYRSGYQNQSGSQNLFEGYRSGFGNLTGSNNTFIGYNSGVNNTSGSHNWALGFQAGPTTSGLANAGALGYNAQVSQDNSLVLGGTGVDAVSVGIGTTAPAATLHVAGAASTMRLEGLAGGSVRMLTAAANGTLGAAPLPTDAQTLSVSGASLSISGGNSVVLPTAADNLGNHTAAQNLNLTDKLLVGGTAATPGTQGLSISAGGSVGIGGTAGATDRLYVDGGHMRLGLSAWGSAANDRLLKFGDADYVTIGETGADDVMQLRAQDFVLCHPAAATPAAWASVRPHPARCWK